MVATKPHRVALTWMWCATEREWLLRKPEFRQDRSALHLLNYLPNVSSQSQPPGPHSSEEHLCFLEIVTLWHVQHERTQNHQHKFASVLHAVLWGGTNLHWGGARLNSQTLKVLLSGCFWPHMRCVRKAGSWLSCTVEEPNRVRSLRRRLGRSKQASLWQVSIHRSFLTSFLGSPDLCGCKDKPNIRPTFL